MRRYLGFAVALWLVLIMATLAQLGLANGHAYAEQSLNSAYSGPQGLSKLFLPFVSQPSSVTKDPDPTDPAACSELIVDGGFETVNPAWVTPLTASQAHYSSVQAHTGTQSMQVGLVPGQVALASLSAFSKREHGLGKSPSGDWVEWAPPGATYSSVYQTIAIPTSSYPVTLTFFYNAGTQDPAALANNDDVQQLLIMDGNTFEVLQDIRTIFTNDKTWHE